MLHFWTYILRCSDGSYYTGHTDNLEGRLWQHRQGIGCEWTRRRRPVELVWQAVFETREEALAAERRIKPWSRAKKEALIRGDWEALSYFARPPHERQAVRHERSAEREVEGRFAQTLERRPSTSLGTNENAATGNK